MQALFLIFFTVVACMVNGRMARAKRRSVGWWTFWGVLFSFLSTLVLWALPTLAPMRVCPAYRSAVPAEATRCRYCAESLPPASRT